MSTMASQITGLTSVYSIVYLSADQRKHQGSALLAVVWGIHRRPVNSPHKGPVTPKMFPFDDVIMICHSIHNTFPIPQTTYIMLKCQLSVESKVRNRLMFKLTLYCSILKSYCVDILGLNHFTVEFFRSFSPFYCGPWHCFSDYTDVFLLCALDIILVCHILLCIYFSPYCVRKWYNKTVQIKSAKCGLVRGFVVNTRYLKSLLNPNGIQ